MYRKQHGRNTKASGSGSRIDITWPQMSDDSPWGRMTYVILPKFKAARATQDDEILSYRRAEPAAICQQTRATPKFLCRTLLTSVHENIPIIVVVWTVLASN